MVTVSPYLSIVTLSVNELNSLIKSHRVAEWINNNNNNNKQDKQQEKKEHAFPWVKFALESSVAKCPALSPSGETKQLQSTITHY